MSKKQLITVQLKSGIYIDIQAWCVDGFEGIFAIGEYNDLVLLAAGDDGFWWEIMMYDPYWHKSISQCFVDCETDIKRLIRRKR